MTTPRQTSRRQFLQGESAGQAAADAARALLTPGESPPSTSTAPTEPAAYLLKVARRAMACEFQVLLNAGQYPHGSDAALAALDRVDQIEEQLSVYRASSELSQLNQCAASAAVQVEQELYKLLALAREIGKETLGAYDITSGPLSAAWGFKFRRGNIPQPQALAEARERVGWQHVELDDAACSVRFLREGVELNLNSMGKGYALDCCEQLLLDAGVNDFLLHGGNSSVLARGSQAGRVERGWSIGVRHPLRPQRHLGAIELAGRALSTSGSGTQFFEHEGHRYGHILDPRTGWPAEGVLAATVLAPTAALADALSTAFYVLGAEGAAEYCNRHEKISALLVLAEGSASTSQSLRLCELGRLRRRDTGEQYAWYEE